MSEKIKRKLPLCVGSIVKTCLENSGADGLYNEDDECGCGLDDFEPCGEMQGNCCVAKKVIAKDNDEVDGIMAGMTYYKPVLFEK